MPRFVAIDLTGLSPPDIVEELDFEEVLGELKQDIVERMAEMGIVYDVHMIEADPVVKFLEVAAFRETLLRARVNSAARAVMLALAQKNDLDHLGVYYAVQRQVLQPATANTPAVLEDDKRLRERIQLAPEALSIAGPEGAYRFHTMTADTSIKDVGVITPEPGHVDVVPLVNIGDGTPSPQLLDKVRLALRKEDIRPLTDILNVRPPNIVNYQVEMHLEVAEGPDLAVVRQAAIDRINDYTFSRHSVGFKVARSGLFRAAHVDGVENATIIKPETDIDPGEYGAAFATSVAVTAEQQDPLLPGSTLIGP